jgi:hypothetical protein
MEITLSTIDGSNFLVAEKDYAKDLGWDDAIKISATIGEGWRLPSKEELQEVYLNKEKLNLKSEAAYWSASETEDAKTQRNFLGFSKGKSKNAWLLDFTNGEWCDFIEKSKKFKIRFVKDYGEAIKPDKQETEMYQIQKPPIKEMKIGNQIWMAENLNVDKFRNGDLIPEAKTDEEWITADENNQPAWCYINNDPATANNFGKLYNWPAVADPRGLAPEGWHIPNDMEWEKLDLAFFKTREEIECCFPLANGVREINTNNYSNSSIWWSSDVMVGWSFESSYFYRENYGEYYGLSVQCIKND